MHYDKQKQKKQIQPLDMQEGHRKRSRARPEQVKGKPGVAETSLKNLRRKGLK